MEDKISIIIAIYNAEKYIKQCLDSILSQTYKNIEVLCINDASSDKSAKIIKEYTNKYSFIKLYENSQNLGPGASRNIGIRNANGKFIHFIDADDFLTDNSLYSTAITEIKKNRLDIFVINNSEYDEISQCFIDEKQKKFPYPHSQKMLNHVLTEKELDCCKFGLIPFACSKIYDAEFLLKNMLYFPEGIFYEDAAFTNCLSLLVKRVYITNNEYYAYRINVTTSTTQNIYDKFDSIIKMHLFTLKFIRERNLWNDKYIRYKYICSHLYSLFHYFLPQLNSYELNRKMYNQIIFFINQLQLSKTDFKNLKYKDIYIYLFIKHVLSQKSDVLYTKLIIWCNFILLNYTERIYQTEIKLFDFIPIYRIKKYKNKNWHYLFNFLPFIKLKCGKVFLFGFIKIFRYANYVFYVQNYEFTSNKWRGYLNE